MWDTQFYDFVTSLKMRLPAPSLEAVQAQLPRLEVLLKTQPELDKYLRIIMDKFEYNLWSGWMCRSFDDITLKTCAVHQLLLLRLLADDTLQMAEDPLYRANVTEKPSVSIIIPAWNQWSYTHLTLTSLFSKTVWPDYEVIVIDNASEDETPVEIAKIAREERRLRVIRNSRNLGFSGANNQGVEAAAHEHLIFLNNDIRILHADWIGQMMRSFRVHPRVGATGQFAVLDCFDGDREELYQKIFFPGFTIPVSWISGYNLLTTRRALADAGGWRGDLYGVAGYEDIHLGYALRQAGWMCVSPCQIPVIEHLIGKTRNTPAGKKFVSENSPSEDKHKIFCRHFGSRQLRPAA